MLASILLRWALLLFIDNAEPITHSSFFPIFSVWIGVLFATPTQSPDVQSPGSNLIKNDNLG